MTEWLNWTGLMTLMISNYFLCFNIIAIWKNRNQYILRAVDMEKHKRDPQWFHHPWNTHMSQFGVCSNIWGTESLQDCDPDITAVGAVRWPSSAQPRKPLLRFSKVIFSTLGWTGQWVSDHLVRLPEHPQRQQALWSHLPPKPPGPPIHAWKLTIWVTFLELRALLPHGPSRVILQSFGLKPSRFPSVYKLKTQHICMS